MKFFDAQKKLVKLWFVWVMLIIALVTYHLLFGVFRYDSAQPVMVFVGLYIAPVFSLILGSNFLDKEKYEEEIKDIFIYKLAYYTSVFYLLIFSLTMLALIKSTTAEFNNLMKNAKLLFAFLEIINGGVLIYFFSKNKK